jgi:HSP20 family molecular chaperone IbpA
MTRLHMLASPLMLGFDDLERLVERASKLGSEGYPPYNIERLSSAPSEAGGGDRGARNAFPLRITLAVAGFTRDQLDVVIEDRHLVIRGQQGDDKSRVYLHRGIAARQFTRSFVLADGVEVVSADLDHGLLTIDLIRRDPERVSQRIVIQQA